MSTKQVLRARSGWVAAALLLILVTYLFTGQQSDRLKASTPVTVTYHDPEDSRTEEVKRGGSPSFPDGPAIEGYTFLYWKDSDGQQVLNREQRLYEDAEYFAVYAMAFDKSGHESYLPLDEDGCFHPNDSISRRDAAQLLYDMLGTDLVGQGRFTDVEKKDSGFKAVATLKDLGVIAGSRFHPDEAITRYEFLQMLTAFFPAEEKNVRFADLNADAAEYPVFRTAARLGWIESGKSVEARPHEELTRGELAHILCQVLERHGDQAQREKMVGTILDVPTTDPLYWEAAELAIPHSFRQIGEEEIWLKSKALPLREEGFFFLGTCLHAINSDGVAVSDGRYKNIDFDSAGRVTSGNEELDVLVRATLDELVDPSTMDSEEMLRTVFDYTVNCISYRKKDLHDPGNTSWVTDTALDIFKTYKGNCYCFAAMFYELSRFLGYDTQIFSGMVNGEDTLTPHSWTEITLDGQVYMFDPEMQYNSNWGGYDQFYKRTPEELAAYNYNKEAPAYFKVYW